MTTYRTPENQPQPLTQKEEAPILDGWQTDEALTVLAAVQALPDDTPGKEELLEEAEQVREVAQSSIVQFDLDPELPEVRQGIEDGVLAYDPENDKVVDALIAAEDLKPKEFSEEERMKLLVYGFFVNHFRTQHQAAEQQAMPASFDEEYAPLLAQALVHTTQTDPDLYRVDSARQILETHNLRPLL